MEIVELDYNKPETLATAFKDVSKLFLLTPFQSDMLDLTSKLLVNAAKKSGVKYIIKQSVMGADAEPGITPGRLHRQAENYRRIWNTIFILAPKFLYAKFSVNFYHGTIKIDKILHKEIWPQE